MDPVCGHSKIAPPPPSLQHFERDLEILILDHSKIAPHPPPRSLQLVERDLEILNFFKILNIDHLKINLAPLSLQQFEGVLKIFGHSVFLYALSPPPHPQFCSCCSKFCSCFKKTRKLGHRCASLTCIT